MALIAIVLGAVAPTMAHPHIFIDAKLVVIFDNSGAVSALRHQWQFDEAFSAWAVQGLDIDGDRMVSSAEMQELANENLAGLGEYGYYTLAGDASDTIRFTSLGDQAMSLEDGRVTLTYTIAAQQPIAMNKPLVLGIHDPEYYVAISFGSSTDVTLENAPQGCLVNMAPPQELDAATAEKLYALGPDVAQLPPDLAVAVRDTQGQVRIKCLSVAGEAPTSALEAVNQLSQAKSAPFGGPPAEIGLPTPQGGVFTILKNLQRQFYAALTDALGTLKSDFTAFWVLGGLSFLYGVVHAAGPGHGKVVVSSYMLANESQARRGITLSILSALMQSVVAVGFVLVAAGVLGMTSLAMSDAARWIVLASYAMVVLLGLWLIGRKLFGWGHHHHRDHEHHEHGDCEHGHVVTPMAVGGSWREQLGVVLSVGLRPCSGALVVLVFALSQGVLAAGIVAVFLMGAGTAITVAVLATLAVSAKGMAQRIGGVDNAGTAALVWWVELAGAMAVLGFGLLLLVANF
ncbi:DUF1007 family protein [Devosia rhodophyticola]|uniref:DUF1007 family protein n=1 Tax=Devosia rhodophyticola TaxID=3026423 RepID=A0ABY7YVG6_9HYPH|nr:DUF1007 family protein [Devosia rhodophyticola]WDR05098.1 DUF1007 family protein [Devosia rhodophyticola]